MFLPKFDKYLVQSLKEHIHLSPAHPNCSSHSEIGSGVAVMMRAPVCEYMWTNGLTVSWSNHPASQGQKQKGLDDTVEQRQMSIGIFIHLAPDTLFRNSMDPNSVRLIWLCGRVTPVIIKAITNVHNIIQSCS